MNLSYGPEATVMNGRTPTYPETNRILSDANGIRTKEGEFDGQLIVEFRLKPSCWKEFYARHEKEVIDFGGSASSVYPDNFIVFGKCTHGFGFCDVWSVQCYGDEVWVCKDFEVGTDDNWQTKTLADLDTRLEVLSFFRSKILPNEMETN